MTIALFTLDSLLSEQSLHISMYGPWSRCLDDKTFGQWCYRATGVTLCD